MAYKREYQDHSKGNEAAWRQFEEDEEEREAESKRWNDSGAAMWRVSTSEMEKPEAELERAEEKELEERSKQGKQNSSK